MANAAEKPKARSPYQKYGKSPFRYEHPNCRHARSVEQSTPTWRGHACATCNIITGGPYATPARTTAEAGRV